MCGIVGVLDPARTRNRETALSLVRAMSDQMVPRGPDGDGYWADPTSGIAFGHRRLSVIDLSEHGHQPMSSTDDRYVITYNGEIYNHVEISRMLAAEGVRFRGHSDTEVLIEAIAQWGIDLTLDRVDGMFAFGCWDAQRRVLTLARDRLGEKPLYYGKLDNGELVFGSSLDALRVHPDFRPKINRDAVAMFLRYKYVPAPHSIYQRIHKLEPGHVAEFDASGQTRRSGSYWSFYDRLADQPPFEGDAYDAADRLDELLGVAVRRRMVADVPVGVFLSGGIDSSTIAAIAAEQSTEAIRTFTIGSSAADYDESTHAREVAAHLGATHTELIVDEHDALDAVHTLAASHDEPFADSSQIPTRLVSELARSEVTVALSGDAGDELFGGYNRYTWVPGIWNRLGRVPLSLRRPVAAVGRRVPPAMWERAAGAIPERRRPQQVALKASKLLAIADASDPEEMFHRLCSHWTSPTKLVPGAVERPDAHTDRAAWPPSSGIVEHMMAVDAVTFLPDDILAKVDRAAMSVSLETRIPLLDRDIVEFAISLPTSMKIRDGISKWPLRKVLDRHVPAHLVDRPKAGFGLPIDDWLRGPLRGWADERLVGDLASPILETDIVARTWSEHLAGSANNAYELWDVIMFADWCAYRGLDDASG